MNKRIQISIGVFVFCIVVIIILFIAGTFNSPSTSVNQPVVITTNPPITLIKTVTNTSTPPSTTSSSTISNTSSNVPITTPILAPVIPTPVISIPAPVPSVPAVPTPVPSVPVTSSPIITNLFNKVVLNSTTFNEDGGGNTYYFDRHTLDCNNNPINSIHLNRNADKIQFEYNCISGGSFDNVISGKTIPTDAGNGDIRYLDRHNIDCSSKILNNQYGGAITKLHYNRDDDKNIHYQYSCLPSNVPLTCRQVNTDFNDDGNGNSLYLDRHQIKCNDNEALSQFQLHRNDKGDQVQYNYTCCSVK